MIKIIILSIIQGITEFLPISSSGHLLLAERFLNFNNTSLSFDAFLHLGTLLAVLIYFNKDIWRLIKSFFNKDVVARKFAYLIVLATLPAVIVGLLVKDLAATSWRSSLLVIFNLIFWGIVLFFADWFNTRNKTFDFDEYKMPWCKGLIVGIFQALALIPGTSRSGITISAGLLQKIDKKTATRFSFLLGIPAIAGAGLLSLLDIVKQSSFNFNLLIVGFLFSFLSGILAIHWLLKILNKGGLRWLAIYRIVLGLSILIFMFFK